MTQKLEYVTLCKCNSSHRIYSAKLLQDNATSQKFVMTCAGNAIHQVETVKLRDKWQNGDNLYAHSSILQNHDIIIAK